MIWLLRHGDAEDDAADDASRKLTEKGRRQAENAGKAMAALGVEAEETDSLRGGEFDIADVAAGRGEVMLVGHEPDFHRAIQAATGGLVKLKKGGLAAVEGNEIHLLLRPADLEKLAS